MSDEDDDLVLEVAENQNFERIADLSMDEKKERLDKYWKSCWEDYQVGDYLDAQDTYSKWMLAKITYCDENQVQVRFDGWPSKWDLQFSWNSSKIVPLRVRSNGYTGQPKAPLRPKYFFDEQQLAQEKIQIETMIERDFERYTARDLTQFLRGRLYVYNDFLMSAIHKDLTDEQQDMIDQYFKSVLRLITAWLRKCPKTLHKSLGVLSKNFEMFLVDEDLALLESQSELFLTLKSFFCGCHRNLRIYAYYDRPLETFDKSITNPEYKDFDFVNKRQEPDSEYNSQKMMESVVDRDTDLVFGSALNYVNYFHDQGGFDAFLDLLRIGNTMPEGVSDGEMLTFEMIQSMVDIFQNCAALLDHEWFDNYIQQIYDIVLKRLNSLKDVDIKNIDRQSIPHIIQKLHQFLTLTRRKDESAKLTEPLAAQMAVRFMKTSFLEKRIQGCISLDELVQRVDVKMLLDTQKKRLIEKGLSTSKISTSFPSQSGKIYPTYWLGVEQMRDFIVQEQVIETLFGENSHPELFKRSTPFLKFLSRRNGMTSQILDRIWICQDGKHEETVRVIYQVIIDIVPDLPTELLHYFYDKIQNSVTEGLSAEKINFLKDFTNQALGNERRAKKRKEYSHAEDEEMQDGAQNPMVQSLKNMTKAVEDPEAIALSDQKVFGLDKIWTWVQDGNIKPEMYCLALDALIEVLQGPYSSRVRIYFLFKALQNLKNSKSLYTSLQVLTTVLNNLDFDEIEDQDDTYVNEAQVINGLEVQLGIVDILMQQTTHYFQQVQSALKELIKKNLAPKDCSEQVFVGSKNHLASINKLLETFEFIVLKSKHHVNLKPENVQALWNIFVHQPVFVDDQAQFLNWINKRRTIRVRIPKQLVDQMRNDAIRSGNYQAEIPTTKLTETQLLSSAEQKHLFVNVLCNQNVCDYSKFSVGEAKCFHQMFRLINEDEGLLHQYANTLEVNNFEEIIGLESLWQLAIESSVEKTRQDSRQILVLLHLKLCQNYTDEDKKAVMTKFLKKCLQFLKQATTRSDTEKPMSEDQRTAKILSIIRIIHQFMHKFEGRKPIKPEFKFYGYYQQQPWIVGVVYRQGQNQTQTGQIKVSQFETLGAVRQRAADFFKLDLNEFDLKVLNQHVNPDIDDDRYCKDFGMSQQIHLYPNKEYNKAAHPKFLIEKDKDLFELIFYLLNKKANQPSLVEPVWELLQELPLNQNLLERVQTLQGVQEEGWDKLLDPTTPSKLLYCLKIIDGLNDNDLKKVLVNSDQPMADWQNRFIELGGFKHLLNTFCSLSEKGIDNKLTLKCFDQLVRALEQFSAITEAITDPENDERGIVKTVLENKKNLIISCLKTVHEIARYTIKIETDRGESIEKMIQRKNQLQEQAQKAKFKGKDNGEEDNQAESDLKSQIIQLNKDYVSTRQLVERIFNLMGTFVIRFDNQSLNFISEYEELSEFLTQALVLSENQALRNECGKRIREILTNCSGDENLKGTITIILKALLNKTLECALKPNSRCSEFFTNLRRGIEELKLNDLQPLQEELFGIISTLTDHFYKSPTENVKLLIGLMNLLKVLLQKFPVKKLETGSKLLQNLLNEYLFQDPEAQGKKVMPPKLNQQVARSSAFKLLTVLCRDCLPNLNQVLAFMNKFNQHPSWRTNKVNDWCIQHFDEDKSSTGYVGIKNLGCICYMISLIQQLFMNNGFRESMLSIEDPNHDNQEQDDNMFLQFQQVLMGLQRSERQYINPKSFCHSYKDWEGQPVNVYEQMDVEEFLNQFLDKLENAIKGTPQQKCINSLFGGKYANEMICVGCPHYYERQEPFLALGVEVKHKKSVYEALDSFIKGDMLEGDNAYMCEKCDKKVDALKRTVVKELPKFMILTLKRFEFDMTTLTKVKVNDYCEFPTELEMLPYTQEGIQRQQEIEKRKKEAEEAGGEFDEKSMPPLKRPEGYYKYKLNGVVVHQGTADSGHYYSYIRDQSGSNPEKWYEFNDNIVSDFDPADLANECFGGEEITAGIQGNMKSQKWGNAYLCFYERLDQDFTEEVEQKTEELVVKKEKTEEEAAAEIEELLDEDDKNAVKKSKNIFDRQHPIQLKIALENRKYWQNKFLFAQEYFDFVADLSHSWDTSENSPLNCLKRNDDVQITGQKFRIPNEMSKKLSAKDDVALPSDVCLNLLKTNSPEEISKSSHQVFKFLLSFYLTIQQRAQQKGLIPRLINQIKSYLNADPRNGEWLLSEMTNWEIFEEMLLQNSGKEMPKLVVGIIYASMLAVYKLDKGLLAKHWEGQFSVLANFILTLIKNMHKVAVFTGNYSNYFHILSRFASLGPEAREFLCRARVAGRALDFFFEKLSVNREHFKNIEDLGEIIEKTDPEMGIPTKLDMQMMGYFQMLREKKRLKEITNANPKYKFLFETVSYCVLHIGFDSPYGIDDTKMTDFVDANEATMLFADPSYIARMVYYARKTRSMTSLTKTLMHFAGNDPEKLDILWQTVAIGLKDQDYDHLRPYLYLFEKLMSSNLQQCTQMRSKWLSQFMKICSQNTMYFKWMEAIFDFIFFRLMNKNIAARSWFYQNTVARDILVDWINKHSRQPGQGCRLYKDRAKNAQAMQLNENTQTIEGIIRHQMRYKNTQMYLDQSLPDIGSFDDFDLEAGDFQDFKYLVGDVVMLYDRRKDEWGRWQVNTVLDEMISMNCLEQDATKQVPPSKWLKTDTDKLIPEMLFNKNYRINFKLQAKTEWINQRLAAAKKTQAMKAKQAEANDSDDGSGEFEEDGSEEQENLYD